MCDSICCCCLKGAVGTYIYMYKESSNLCVTADSGKWKRRLALHLYFDVSPEQYNYNGRWQCYLSYGSNANQLGRPHWSISSMNAVVWVRRRPCLPNCTLLMFFELRWCFIFVTEYHDPPSLDPFELSYHPALMIHIKRMLWSWSPYVHCSFH